MQFRNLLDREYRRLATGFCFLTFMAGGLVGTLLVLPLFHLLPVHRPAKRRYSLAFVQTCFRLFTRIMVWLRVIGRFRVRGLESVKGKGPFLFIANHPSLIDVVATLGIIPRCNCIVKRELFNHPFMGGVLRMSGVLPNDAGPALLESFEAEVAEGRSLLVFPEGTRSPKDGLHPFNRGAARLALHTNLPILPVVITCEPSTLRKDQHWYEVPDRAVDFTLVFGDPIDPESAAGVGSSRPLRVRALTRFLENSYRQRD